MAVLPSIGLPVNVPFGTCVTIGEVGTGQAAGADAGRGRWDGAHPARERLLDAVVAHFTEEGLADQSLRRIAEAVGTSHRMLLYHFGSKDGLLLAVVREVEARTQGRLAGLERGRPRRDRRADPPDVGLPGRPRRWATSSACSSPSTGGRCKATTPIRPLLDDDVAHWLDANVALSARWGVPADVAGPTPVSGWR